MTPICQGFGAKATPTEARTTAQEADRTSALPLMRRASRGAQTAPRSPPAAAADVMAPMGAGPGAAVLEQRDDEEYEPGRQRVDQSGPRHREPQEWMPHDELDPGPNLRYRGPHPGRRLRGLRVGIGFGGYGKLG